MSHGTALGSNLLCGTALGGRSVKGGLPWVRDLSCGTALGGRSVIQGLLGVDLSKGDGPGW